jgi:hypothetical protein
MSPAKGAHRVVAVAIATPIEAELVASIGAISDRVSTLYQSKLARDLVHTFAAAQLSVAERHMRRLAAVADIERDGVDVLYTPRGKQRT